MTLASDMDGVMGSVLYRASEFKARWGNMNWLNYHHLQYFWKVAKTGSIARASVELRLSSPTISAQIQMLERSLGHKLLRREGRGLVLTDSGREAFRFADSIFATGDALLEAMGCGTERHGRRVAVGVADSLPSSVVQRLLAPVFALQPAVVVTCRQQSAPDGFVSDLAAGALDVVLSDTPAPAGASVPMFSHPMGESGTGFFAAPSLGKELQSGFPAALHRAPFLYPSIHSAMRRGLDEWCDANSIAPRIVAELDDTALAASLAQNGLGVLVAAEEREAELFRNQQLRLVGCARELRHAFYAWVLKKKVLHPAVVALCRDAATRSVNGAYTPRFV